MVARQSMRSSRRESLSVLVRYMRSGWDALSGYDMRALGFDPFRHGPVSELTFRQRAAELLDSLADHHFVED